MTAHRTPLLLGIETGGTKIACALALASAPLTILDQVRFATTSPADAAARIQRFSRDTAPRGETAGVGIASFGPLDVDPASATYGRILRTPKSGWEGTDVLGLAQPRGGAIPTRIMTDVSAAAWAEHRHGAAQGFRHMTYLTVGTGIGAGIVVSDTVVHGNGFPEAGHLRVQRFPGDDFPGACPFHGDCAEGLTSGPAIHARWGHTLSHPNRPPDAVATVAWYIAQVAYALTSMVGSKRVVLGGGVSKTPGLRAAVAQAYESVSGVPRSGEEIFTSPHFEDAGLSGALMLAASACR